MSLSSSSAASSTVLSTSSVLVRPAAMVTAPGTAARALPVSSMSRRTVSGSVGAGAAVIVKRSCSPSQTVGWPRGAAMVTVTAAAAAVRPLPVGDQALGPWALAARTAIS